MGYYSSDFNESSTPDVENELKSSFLKNQKATNSSPKLAQNTGNVNQKPVQNYKENTSIQEASSASSEQEKNNLFNDIEIDQLKPLQSVTGNKGYGTKLSKSKRSGEWILLANCPVCGSTSGKCKSKVQNEDSVFCMNSKGERKGSKVPGLDGQIWYVTSEGKSLWAILKPYVDYKPTTVEEIKALEDKKQQYQVVNAENAKKREQEDIKRKAETLSAAERHEQYTRLLDELDLDQATINDLTRRGFTMEQIERHGFKSTRTDMVFSGFDPRLPGANNRGEIHFKNSGYLCPMRDVEGRIVAFQVRLLNSYEKMRYKWLSGTNEYLKIQPYDENPLAIFYPQNEPKGIAICEGVGAKPLFVTEKYDFVTIGAAGGQWVNSSEILEHSIAKITEKFGALPIYFIPDAGSILDFQVWQRSTALLEWLKEEFQQKKNAKRKDFKIYERNLLVFDWYQISKSAGDIDETKQEIKILNIDQYLGKYKRVSREFINYMNNRVQLTSDYVVESDWFEFPEQALKADIVMVRAAMGSGKTHASLNFIQKCDELVALLLSYRNLLVYQIVKNASDKFGIHSLHVHEKDSGGVDFSQDPDLKLLGNCIDSYIKDDKFLASHPEFLLMLDEWNSVYDHIINGGTLKSKQKEAIKWLMEKIEQAKLVFMMDAHLSDREVNKIRVKFPNKKIAVVDHQPATKKIRDVFICESEQFDIVYSTAVKHLKKEKCRFLIICDFQRQCEYAEEFCKKLGLKVFRLDGKTSSKEEAKEFLEKPPEFTIQHDFDVVILSPSAESGVSIKFAEEFNGYFDAILCFYGGAINLNSMMQMTGRLRHWNVPMFVGVPEVSSINKDDCPYPDELINLVLGDRLKEFVLNGFSEEFENFDPIEILIDHTTKRLDRNLFNEMMDNHKRQVFERKNLKLCFVTALAQAGHNIIDLSVTKSDQISAEWDLSKIAVKERIANRIYTAEDIDQDVAYELRQRDINEEERYKLNKFNLKQALPTIEKRASWKPRLIEIFAVDNANKQWITKRLRYQQLIDEEFFKAQNKIRKSKSLKGNISEQSIWYDESSKIKAHKEFGFIQELLQYERINLDADFIKEAMDRYSHLGKRNKFFVRIGLKQPSKAKNAAYTFVESFLNYFGFEINARIMGLYIEPQIPKVRFTDEEELECETKYLDLKEAKKDPNKRDIKRQKTNEILKDILKDVSTCLKIRVHKIKTEDVAAVNLSDSLFNYAMHTDMDRFDEFVEKLGCVQVIGLSVVASEDITIEDVTSKDITIEETVQDFDLDDVEFFKIYLENCYLILHDQEEFIRVCYLIEHQSTLGTKKRLRSHLKEMKIPVTF